MICCPIGHLEFRTVVVLTVLLGIVMALLNHFVVLSSDKYAAIFGALGK
jgi:hypothetical protein